MKRLVLAATFFLFTTSIWIGELSATVLARRTVEELATAAELVLTGRCTALESRWLDATLVTLATVTVGETWKGPVYPQVTVVLPGGVDTRRPVPVQVIWPGAPQLGPGEHAVLFLVPFAELPGTYAIAGFSQGAFRIATDETGESVVYRNLTGLRLVAGSEVPAGVPGGAGSWPLAEFRRRVEEALAGEGR